MMLKLICATKCSNNHMHPQIYSQESLQFTITLAVLRGVALPHLKRGSLDPWSWAPARSTPRSQDLARPTPWSRDLARLTLGSELWLARPFGCEL